MRVSIITTVFGVFKRRLFHYGSNNSKCPLEFRSDNPGYHDRWNIYVQSGRQTIANVVATSPRWRSDFSIAKELIFGFRKVARKPAVDSLPRNYVCDTSFKAQTYIPGRVR